MDEENEYLPSVNNYCLTLHTMNVANNIFSLVQHKTLQEFLLDQNINLINNNCFKYEKWLTRE